MPLPRRTAAAMAAVLAAGAVIASGCGPDPGVVGSVRVAGSSTLLPFVQQATAAFTAQHPLARVDVDLTGTADGLSLLCDGIADAAAASRGATAREARDCAASGVRAVPLLVGRDAIVVFTARGARTPSCLSLRELELITGKSAAAPRTWDGFGASGLPLVLVVPEAGSGTRDAFVSRVLGQGSAGTGVLRGDAIPAQQGRQMLARVLGARGAIGITGFATTRSWQGNARLIEVNGGDGCVAPTDESIASGAYPLTRDIFMFMRTNDDGADGEAAVAFGDVVASPALLSRPGSGLSSEDIRATEQAWDDRDQRGSLR